MNESNVLKTIMLKVSKMGVSIFRNNVGTGFVGRSQKIIKPVTVLINGIPVSLKPGDIVIQEPRMLNAGLHKGSSDLIGWKSIKITPEMVGKNIAVFTSIEGKKHNGRISPEQTLWIQVIRNAGGIAGVARSENEAENLIEKFMNDLKGKP